VLFREQLEDWIAEDNPVRAVEAFVEELDPIQLGFGGEKPADTGSISSPAYLTVFSMLALNATNRSRGSQPAAA
jgi:hypothetical protein